MCCLISQYTGRPIQSIVPNSLMAPNSLDLDMSIFPRKFEEPLGNCSDHLINPSVGNFMPETSNFGGGVLILDEEKSLAMELAISSVEVLLKMCQMAEPLWIRTSNEISGKEVLNVEEYLRMFPWPGEIKQNSTEIRTEASRHSAVVIMNSITLVDAFLDAVSLFFLLSFA